MSASGAHHAGDLSVQEAWDLLNREEDAVLVDVRSAPEWQFVGLPRLDTLSREPVLLSWQAWPGMERNAAFEQELGERVRDPQTPILFLCRSGARSRAAAIAMAGRGYSRCFNVAGGFEGDKDAEAHRGRVNGWKAAGLPWIQE